MMVVMVSKLHLHKRTQEWRKIYEQCTVVVVMAENKLRGLYSDAPQITSAAGHHQEHHAEAGHGLPLQVRGKRVEPARGP